MQGIGAETSKWATAIDQPPLPLGVSSLIEVLG
jgi:hypothetical protein